MTTPAVKKSESNPPSAVTSPAVKKSESAPSLVPNSPTPASNGTLTIDKDTLALMNSPELQAIISEVVKKRDPLDEPNFDVPSYINKLFPSEQSLSGVDVALQRINVKIQHLDDDILRTVREQASESAKGTQNLESAKRAIVELAQKMKDIKFKAETSEKIVKEIVADIKTLDNANHNLSNTISVLRRFNMYLTAVDQLKGMAQNKQYREAAGLLEAVGQLDKHFSQYVSNPRVNKIHENFVVLRQNFGDLIYNEWKSINDPANITDDQRNTLSDLCYIVDALGTEAKDKFVKWFCGRELAEYNKFFQPGEESSKLENTDRRYAWLFKSIKKFDDYYTRIFPSYWAITEWYCEEYCAMTRHHLSVILAGSKSFLVVDTLILALKRTIQLEKSIIQKFGGIASPVPVLPQVIDTPQPSEEIPPEDLSNPDLNNPHSESAIRLRWKRHREEREKKLREQQQMKIVASVEKNPARFQGMVSSIFDAYMDLCIKQEDANLRDMMTRIQKEETYDIDDDKIKVLYSSTDLFDYYKSSLKILTSLTKGPVLYDLFVLFKKYLREYASLLGNRIPVEGTKFSSKDEKAVCLIVNTAEYCGNTVTGLAATFKKNVGLEFQEKIELQEEKDEFETLNGKALRCLAASLVAKLDAPFAQMTRMPWGTWTYVDDQSAYVNAILTVIHDTIPNIASWIATPAWYGYFCKDFLGLFVPAFLANISKCKKISQVGAQQMMVDVGSIKTMLLDLPKAGNYADRGYPKSVKREMTKPENVLKVILAPQNMVVDTYKGLFPEGTEQDFITIMDLRGLQKSDQRLLLDQYKGITVGAQKKTAFTLNFPNVFAGLPATLGATNNNNNNN